MKNNFDAESLSAYLDGELDSAGMQEVEMCLDSDEFARQQLLLEAVKVTAHLRSELNDVLAEDIPERLTSVLKRPYSRGKNRKPVLRNLVRVAAAVVLFVFGFGSAELIERSGLKNRPAFVEPLTGTYAHVIDAALENNLSGTPFEWHAGNNRITVRATPVKTYRDRNGVFYREYRLEVSDKNQHMQVNGLAYRASKGNWKTKALYF